MSAGLVTAAIGLGAAAIALWIDVRFPRLAPRDMGKAVLHVVVSIGAGYAMGPAIQALTATEDPRMTMLAVFGGGLPAVVYCLLAGLWMIKVAQQLLGGYLR